MAVIINEFEVIPDSSEEQEVSSASDEEITQKNTQLDPMDVEDIQKFQVQRMLRTWAD